VPHQRARTPTRRYVLTGAPGAGKTSVLRALQERGYAVVEEAATDVISSEQRRGTAEPWQRADFIDKVVALQRRRQREPVTGDAGVQVYDRSPVCTLALARYLRHPVTPLLAGEVARIIREQVYQRVVFLVRPIGFAEPTAARRISYQDSLEFEGMHEAAYRECSFEIVHVAAAAVPDRADAIASIIASHL
jgi:predicted ATPase